MSRDRLVYKFGGSSVADAERIRHVASLVAAAPSTPVVVVSALGGVTDRLVRAAGMVARGDDAVTEVLDELRDRHREVLGGLCDVDDTDDERARLRDELDAVLARLEAAAGGGAALDPDHLLDDVSSIGEDLSTRLVSCAIRRAGTPSEPVDARTVVRTDERFGRARPDDDEVRRLARERLVPLLDEGTVPVVQGFVGATADGRTTTLGRGGSDFTAAILGAALDADAIHIWTDVDGILTGDPRAVDHPRILEEVGYEEAVELAYFGAKVIHPGAAKHAVSHGVPVRIRNTFRPDDDGTLILSDRRGGVEIAAVAHKPDVVLIKVRSQPSSIEYGFLARVFEVLARYQLPVDLVATSHSSTAFTIDENEDADAAADALREFAEVEIVRDLATITVVGHGLMEEPGTDALIFWAVERTPVHLISQASDVSLSFVVDARDAPELVQKLHLTLIELRDEEARAAME